MDVSLRIDTPDGQATLRCVRAAINAGRFRRPTTPLSPALARQLTVFRESVDAAVDLLCVGSRSAIALVAPHDGGELFILMFDAFENLPDAEQAN